MESITESKHTLGLWDAWVTGGCVYVGTEDHKITIADICNLADGIDNKSRKEERIGNARLMAVAPLMLMALKEIAEGRGAFSRDPLTHAENIIERMKTIARAAIAKAEGVTA